MDSEQWKEPAESQASQPKTAPSSPFGIRKNRLASVMRTVHRELNQSMSTFLNFTIGAIALAASILQFISFLSERTNRKIFISAACLICSFILLGLGWWGERANAKEKSRHTTEKTIDQQMRIDARIVVDSIVISGWEDGGDYIGYLTQAAGFYRRYSAQFPIQAESSKKELEAWQDELRKLRIGGARPSSFAWEDLKGLVRSYQSHLQQIAGNG